jgi:hypothetical protein
MRKPAALSESKRLKTAPEAKILRSVPVQKAVGRVLCHDITRIIPGKFKGRAFKKGHLIQPEDIPQLLDLGKENIYVLDLPERFLHENDAARRIAEGIRGPGIALSEPAEGRINLRAVDMGLLKVKVNALQAINEIDEVMVATLHTQQKVDARRVVAGTRIIPLVIGEEKIRKVERICRKNAPVVEVKPFRSIKVGVVITGSEVYHGRIKDQFGPVIQEKFAELGSRVERKIMVSDQVPMTVKAIHDLLQDGVEMIAVTGGMSVDPDDQTPASIRAAGGKIVTYGAPVLPGSMFMLAYIKNIPIVGLPGCVLHDPTTIFDLLLPRLLAGEKITRRSMVALGHGGLCAHCPDCRFPLCSFGKGS